MAVTILPFGQPVTDLVSRAVAPLWPASPRRRPVLAPQAGPALARLVAGRRARLVAARRTPLAAGAIGSLSGLDQSSRWNSVYVGQAVDDG